MPDDSQITDAVTQTSDEPTLFDTLPGTAPSEAGTAGEDSSQSQDPSRPDWFPEEFWKDGKPDLDGFRQSAQSELLKGRPEAADKYEIPPLEGVETLDVEGAEITKWWRETAFARGLSQEDFNKGVETYVAQIRANGEAWARQEEESLNAERAKLGENADARLQSLGNWVRQTFEGEELAAVTSVARTAAGVKVLEKIMTGLKDGVIPNGADFEPSIDAGPSEEEIKSLMQDRRYWSPANRDPAIVAKVNSYFDKKYGKVR